MSDRIGRVLAALAEPTRRHVVETLLREGSSSAPLLTAGLPMARPVVAKHIAALDEAAAAWDIRLDRLKGAVERRG